MNHHAQHSDSGQGIQDPVCGMTVNPVTALHKYEHDGHTYYFCAKHCLEKFRAEPARYLLKAPGSQFQVPSATAGLDSVYTCPMHPEVRQQGPGSCPLCGMALEPLAITGEEEANPELIDMTRRFRISLAFSRFSSLLWQR